MAYAADLLTVSTGGIRRVCILLVVEFSSASTTSATIEASPPLCIIKRQFTWNLKIIVKQ